MAQVGWKEIKTIETYAAREQSHLQETLQRTVSKHNGNRDHV